MIQLRTDTIAAISTPPGRGAVAIVRVSGAEAHSVTRRCCERWPAAPRVVMLTQIRHPVNGRAIDDALVTRFDAPHSYTGEHMAELSGHGGVAPVAILSALLASGARLAEPGEFTRRAVLHGKMDLLQAEGVLELIDARTAAHRELALAQVHGGLSRHISELRSGLVQLEALLAYDVDFPEEDDGPVPRERVIAAAELVHRQLSALAASAPLAEVARDGAVVVIAGEPNAGKSSLFNALLGEERAIVTEIPGTTRDALEARVERAPWPVRLVDTAGLRPTGDRLERLGIEVSERHIRAAHVVLACGDTSASVAHTVAVVRGLGVGVVIPVRTKCDRATTAEVDQASVAVSARERAGLEHLLERVDSAVQQSLGAMPTDGRVLTRARQQRAIGAALDEVGQFLGVWTSNALPATVAAVHIRAATNALDELIGRVDVEDVLEELFRSFCVGK